MPGPPIAPSCPCWAPARCRERSISPLKVDDHLPLHTSFEVNNQYTADTSKLRVVGSVAYNNLFNRLDSLSLQYQTSPTEPSEIGVFVANFATHVGDNDKQLALYCDPLGQQCSRDRHVRRARQGPGIRHALDRSARQRRGSPLHT